MQNLTSVLKNNWTLDFSDPKIIAVAVIMALAFVAAIILKGIALWRAALKNDKIWFAVLLLVNTMGVLEIIYIYYFNKREAKKA